MKKLEQMKNTILLLSNYFLLSTLVSCISCHVYSNDSLNIRTAPSNCTVITIVKGDSIFFGGNDDYINPDSYYWVEQSDSTKYGVVWIGTPDNPQQGVNEKGLAYDSNGLPGIDVNPHPERIAVIGEYYHNYCMQIMHECATVQEVIDWVNCHQRPPYMHDQLHFADATGDAVIISAGQDGEMVFTRKDPGNGFLVSTNFNIANPANGFGYPCERFDLAQELLSQLIKKEESLRYSDLTNVMDAVHQEGASWTIETIVADLVNRILYIYYFYQYDHPVVLDINNELSNPRESGPLSKLFPEEVRQEAARRYNKNLASLRVNKIVGISWPIIVFVSFILMFLTTADHKKGLRFWIPAILILGPIALIFRIFHFKTHKTSLCLNAIIETLGNIIPAVISYTLAFVILILKMLSGSASPLLQLIVMIGLPVFIGLIFHATFLAPVSNKNFFKFILVRFPQVLTTTFLALGGIIPVAMPVVNKNLNMSLLDPLSPFVVLTWWAIVVLGALLGGFIVFIFELWAVKRGFRSWAVLKDGKGEVRTPVWNHIWWWFLISILVLFTGLIAGVLLV